MPMPIGYAVAFVLVHHVYATCHGYVCALVCGTCQYTGAGRRSAIQWPHDTTPGCPHTCLPACLHACLHACLPPVSTHVYPHFRTHVCMHVYPHVYTHVYPHVYTHV